MRVIIREAGYLISYSFSELEKNKKAYPIFCQISQEGIKKTKEFHNFSLEESVKKTLYLLKEVDEKLFLGACAIFPVETRERTTEKLHTALMTLIRAAPHIEIQILQRYYFKEELLYLEPYRVIYADGIAEEELKKLEKYYLKGIMEYSEGKEIWLRSFAKG